MKITAQNTENEKEGTDGQTVKINPLSSSKILPAANHIFNSLLSVSSGAEALRSFVALDIILERQFCLTRSRDFVIYK